MNDPGLFLIPLLFAVSFGGLAYSFAGAIRAGMQAYDEVYAVDTARQFEDLFLFIPSRRIVDMARIAALTMFALFFFLFGSFHSTQGLITGLVFGCIAAAGAVFSPRLLLRILKQRRVERFNRQLVDGLMGMSNALRAGFSILQAFEVVAKENSRPISEEFNLFLHQVRVGVRVEDALHQLDQRVGSEDLSLMINSIETARQTGGNLTEVFDQIANTIRDRIRMQGRIRSMTSQGRMQAVVVGAMPLLLLLALSILDPGMIRHFLGSAVGLSLLILVGVLELAGFLVIRKIVNVDI